MRRFSLIGPLRSGALLALAALLGCSDGPRVAPVSGLITLNGAPVADARINTQPVSSEAAPNPGPGSFAVTDAEGRYTLELVTPALPGAVLGEHIVQIKKQKARYVEGREDAPMLAKSELPPAALDGSLRLSVPPEGTDSADFQLSTK